MALECSRWTNCGFIRTRMMNVSRPDITVGKTGELKTLVQMLGTLILAEFMMAPSSDDVEGSPPVTDICLLRKFVQNFLFLKKKILSRHLRRRRQ